MNEKYKIRKAIPTDALGIHEAHMKSIQELCSCDHSEEEIKAWGHRPFSEARRLDAINNHFVFVVEMENQVEGFVEFIFFEKEKNIKEVYLYALYLTKKATGCGLGRKLVNIIFEECKKNNLKRLSLSSTITAHSFYQKMGFVDTGPMTTVLFNQTPVRCIPMEKLT